MKFSLSMEIIYYDTRIYALKFITSQTASFWQEDQQKQPHQ